MQKIQKILIDLLLLTAIFILTFMIGWKSAKAQTPSQYCSNVSLCEVIDVKSSTGSNGIGSGSVTTYVKKYCASNTYRSSTQIIHAEYSGGNLSLRRLNNTASTTAPITQSAITSWMNDCDASM